MLKPERLASLLFVLSLHGAVLYGILRYQTIPVRAEAAALMVALINPSHPDKSPQVEPPNPTLRSTEPQKTRQLAVETTVVLPDEPVVPSEPVSPPAPAAQAEAQQAATLSAELSVSCPLRSPPDYPAASVRLNEQGRVVLRVALDAEGRISGVAFESHSGFARLDEAAVTAVKSWRCKPAMRGGVAVASVALQPFEFIMEGR